MLVALTMVPGMLETMGGGLGCVKAAVLIEAKSKNEGKWSVFMLR
jgi:hypothetical protein